MTINTFGFGDCQHVVFKTAFGGVSAGIYSCDNGRSGISGNKRGNFAEMGWDVKILQIKRKYVCHREKVGLDLADAWRACNSFALLKRFTPCSLTLNQLLDLSCEHD